MVTLITDQLMKQTLDDEQAELAKNKLQVQCQNGHSPKNHNRTTDIAGGGDSGTPSDHNSTATPLIQEAIKTSSSDIPDELLPNRATVSSISWPVLVDPFIVAHHMACSTSSTVTRDSISYNQLHGDPSAPPTKRHRRSLSVPAGIRLEGRPCGCGSVGSHRHFHQQQQKCRLSIDSNPQTSTTVVPASLIQLSSASSAVSKDGHNRLENSSITGGQVDLLSTSESFASTVTQPSANQSFCYNFSQDKFTATSLSIRIHDADISATQRTDACPSHIKTIDRSNLPIPQPQGFTSLVTVKHPWPLASTEISASAAIETSSPLNKELFSSCISLPEDSGTVIKPCTSATLSTTGISRVQQRCKSQPSAFLSCKRRRDEDRPTLDFSKMRETAYDCAGLAYCLSPASGPWSQTEHVFTFSPSLAQDSPQTTTSISSRRSLPATSKYQCDPDVSNSSQDSNFLLLAPPSSPFVPLSSNPLAKNKFAKVPTLLPCVPQKMVSGTAGDSSNSDSDADELSRYLSTDGSRLTADCDEEIEGVTEDSALPLDNDDLDLDLNQDQCFGQELDLDLIENN